MNKKIINVILVGLLAVAASACSDHQEESIVQPRVGMDKAFGTFSQTRSTDVDTWDMYDQIGVSMCYHTPNVHPESGNTLPVYYDATATVQPFNRCYYTTASGSSEFTYYSAQDKIWFPEDTTMVDFVAYYPHTAALEKVSDTKYCYPVNLAGQDSNEEPLSKNDLMWGVTRGLNKMNSIVVIPFRHQLTQLVCYIKPVGDLSMEMLKNASVSISHQKGEARMDVLTADIDYMDGDTELGMKTNIAVVDGDSCLVARCIILPNDSEKNPVKYTNTTDKQESLEKNRHIILSHISSDGKILGADLKETEFKPGQKHVFRLDAQLSQLILVRGEIVEWETVEHDETTIID